MNEDELKTTSVEEDAPILPDGWKGEGDVLDPTTWDGTANADPDSGDTQEQTEGEAVPTTDAAEPEAGQSAGETTEEDQSGQTESDVPETPKTYKIKVNHHESELTLEELISKAQIGEALRQKVNRDKFRQVYQEQIDAGMTEAAARLVAKNECDGETYALTDAEEAPETQEEKSPPEETLDKSTTVLAKEIETFYTLHPAERSKQVPDEVALAVSRGEGFTQAYLSYLGAKAQAANTSLKRENKILKQNAEAAAKSPVRGTVGGGDPKVKPESDFLRAFNSEF